MNYGVCPFDAIVVIFQLNLGKPATSLKRTNIPSGTGRIWMDDVHCTRSNKRLEDCRHRGWGINNCNHGEDVKMRCTGSQTACIAGDQWSSNAEEKSGAILDKCERRLGIRTKYGPRGGWGSFNFLSSSPSSNLNYFLLPSLHSHSSKMATGYFAFSHY